MNPPPYSTHRKGTKRRKFTAPMRSVNVLISTETYERLQDLRGDFSMGMAVEYLINRAWERRERKKPLAE